MSLDIEQRLRVFFASAPQTVHAIQTVELSHSAMPQVWRLWREPYAGQVAIEDGTLVDVLPLNLQVGLADVQGNLDRKYDINMDTTDVQDLFRESMAAIPIDTDEKVRCVYREYLSDDLTEIQASAVLQVETASYQVGAATLSAVFPRLNVTRTGILYTTRDIPMLRGFT